MKNLILALLLVPVLAIAADTTTKTPLFTWADPPPGSLGFELICDGQQVGARIPATQLTYQAVLSDFVPAAQAVTHVCWVESVQPGGASKPATNSVTFVVPAVVVTPPVQFSLRVQ